MKHISFTKQLTYIFREKLWKKARPRYRKIRKATIESFKFVTKNYLFFTPIIFYSIYTIFIETPKFESTTSVMIDNRSQKVDTDVPALSLGGLKVGNNIRELTLLTEYINSFNMLKKLDDKFELKASYSKVQNYDIFSALRKNDIQSFLQYYQKHLVLEINEDSKTLVIKYRDVNKLRSFEIIKEIIKQSELFLNIVSDKATEKEITFYNTELKNILSEIRKMKEFLYKKQIKEKTINSNKFLENREITIAKIESDLLRKKTKLAEMSSYLTDDALQIKVAKEKIIQLNKQIEKLKIITISGDKSGDEFSSVTFAIAEIELMFLLEKYKLTLQSLENHKLSIIHSAKHVIQVSEPYLPDKNQYPKIFINILIFSILYGMAFFIIKVIREIIKEHKLY